MASKLEKFKKKLYLNKLSCLFDKAYTRGLITEFDEEVYEKMANAVNPYGNGYFK